VLDPARVAAADEYAATDVVYPHRKGVECDGVGPAMDVENGPKGCGAHRHQERILESELPSFRAFLLDRGDGLANEQLTTEMTMKIFTSAFVLAVGLSGIVAARQAATPAAPVKAVGAIDLKDPAGDMGPITTSDKDQPPLDIVGLSIKSDGTKLDFAATLAGPFGRWATEVLTAYIDTDNNPATGLKPGMTIPGGFDHKAQIELCMAYSNGSEACVGGTSDAKATVTKRYIAIDLKHFKGDAEFGNDEKVLDSMGFPGSKASRQVPAVGQIVQASIDYADLKVKPGQTIRILCREAGGAPKDSGLFPIVVLTLK
jgi:hypothetical protein